MSQDNDHLHAHDLEQTSPIPQSSELQYCHTCRQMTNHGIGTNGGCLKCRVTQSSAVEAKHKILSNMELLLINKLDPNEIGTVWETLNPIVGKILNNLTQQHEAKMREMVDYIWQMREDCRNDGYGQHLVIYDNIIEELTQRYVPTNPETK